MGVRRMHVGRKDTWGERGSTWGERMHMGRRNAYEEKGCTLGEGMHMGRKDVHTERRMHRRRKDADRDKGCTWELRTHTGKRDAHGKKGMHTGRRDAGMHTGRRDACTHRAAQGLKISTAGCSCMDAGMELALATLRGALWGGCCCGVEERGNGTKPGLHMGWGAGATAQLHATCPLICPR